MICKCKHGAKLHPCPQGYEPYVLVARDRMPWADERFRGYSFDKIVLLHSLAGQPGVFLVVHPSVFVVHYPHPKTGQQDITESSGQLKVVSVSCILGFRG